MKLNMPKDKIKEDLLVCIGGLIERYDETEEHDSEFAVDFKDDARRVLEDVQKYIVLS